MKNILIVIANPKEDSFSFAMAHKYKKVDLMKNHLDKFNLFG